MSQRPTLYIIDAYSLIFQVFHAIPLMTGPAGQPTNAVFGIFRDLLNLIRTRKPDYLVAAFDGGGPVFRAEIYPAYKAQRAEMPEDLKPQIDVVRRLFEGFRIPVILVEGYEADDLIATLTRKGLERGADVTIITSDKDARQLISPHSVLLNLRKNTIVDEAALKDDWGIRPDQVVDFLALTGDSVDNVPGVPTIGPGYARKLLESFHSLDEALARIEEVDAAIGKSRRDKLREHADQAKLARQLVTLKQDVPIETNWDELRLEPPDVPALKALCIECGFHRFLDELTPTAPDADRRGQGEWDTSAYTIVDTPEALSSFLNQLNSQPRFSFDTETTSLDPLRAELVGLSFCWKPGAAFYLPVKGPLGSRVLDPHTVLEALAPIFKDPTREIVGQNLKYDMLVLSAHGLKLAGAVTDTMIMSYLLESGERNHNLDELARRLLDHTMIPISALIGKGKNQLGMDQVPVERVAKYAGEDADAAWRIDAILQPRLRSEGMWPLYAELERPLIGVLADMEAAGIRVDVGRLKALSQEFETRLDTIESEIHRYAGRPFNIGSGPQLRQLLFEELKLPVVKKTPKGEPSTDAEVLEELAVQHDLPRLIVQYRQLDKLKNTYLDTLPELVHPDGRIHASFNQAVAATGRLSSSDPNLQNIPARTEDGARIRQAFVAPAPGWSLLTADYSQIELRVLAHFSQDAALLRAFGEGKDIHGVVASQVFGVPEHQVTPEQRRVAKMVNFGVIYGLSAFGLASRLGIPQTEAGAFIDAYFQQYEGVARFIDSTREKAQKDGRVETILGRRRAISGIKNTTGRNLNLAERTAVNTVIQGSAADLIKKAMLGAHRQIAERRLKARMLLQIHDELVFEMPDAECNDLVQLVRHEMTTAIRFDVPIAVEIYTGPNWLDVEPVV